MSGRAVRRARVPAALGFVEQMTYNGYLVARIQVLARSTAVAGAVALVGLSWSFQHAVMPVAIDARYVI